MRFLRKLYEYWMAFGHAIGVIVTPLQLLLIYVLVFGPARLITKVMGIDLLDRKLAPRVSFWSAKEPVPHTVESSRRQF
ncbi:MAG TPA: SxtJ family membrane protein [Patescibacteria group bacterium]|nr:SxtJ family membrane protein [Patescibacteria group bacterium]